MNGWLSLRSENLSDFSVEKEPHQFEQEKERLQLKTPEWAASMQSFQYSHQGGRCTIHARLKVRVNQPQTNHIPSLGVTNQTKEEIRKKNNAQCSASASS